MEVFITHKTALEFWRQRKRLGSNPECHQSWRKLPVASPESSALRHGDTWGLSLPLDILVGEPDARRPSSIVRPHVYSRPLPRGCFVQANDELFVSSPEFCFFHMARELSFIKLIELGFEFCGSYSLPAANTVNEDPNAGEKTLYDLSLLTNTKKLSLFAKRMTGERGQRQVVKALQYVIDESASPMETILVMLLTLPYRLGGYGLPKPELNRRIDLSKTARQKSRKDYYRCDLYWPEANLVVEYDSDLHHTGSKRITEDSQRRNALASIGKTVITVTSQQIYSTVEFERVVKIIATNLGKRIRDRNPKFYQARLDLRKLLP